MWGKYRTRVIEDLSILGPFHHFHPLMLYINALFHRQYNIMLHGKICIERTFQRKSYEKVRRLANVHFQINRFEFVILSVQVYPLSSSWNSNKAIAEKSRVQVHTFESCQGDPVCTLSNILQYKRAELVVLQMWLDYNSHH